MKKKQKMLVTAAMVATLATSALPTTLASAAETNAPIQQQESQKSIQPFSQSNLEIAVNAALYGPEVKKIKVFEHETS